MKKLKLLLLVAVAFVCLTATAFAKPVITSDSNYFDFNKGQYVLEGHVFVQTGGRTITADKAQVSITTLEVWGQGNVKVVQDDITFTGGDVYVSGAKKTAEIGGGVDLEREHLSIKADKVVYNWKTKLAEFTGNVKVVDGKKKFTAETLQYDMKENKILESKVPESKSLESK